MRMVMGDIPPTMGLVFLDDVLVHGTTFETHLVALDKVLAAHGKNATCSLPKWITLGTWCLVSSAEGIQLEPTLLDTIKQWPCPKTHTEVRVFLGKIGFYRNFIANFGERAKVLQDIMSQDGTADDQPFLPNPTVIKSIEDLKKALATAPFDQKIAR